ncbi:MAG TPA: transglycosylase SLT domain-containing protein [Enterovirga sp.]|jgi:hypothetical protein|nr:transglycosylase SLT domain-containing protein [Enterovirga sp.]
MFLFTNSTPTRPNAPASPVGPQNPTTPSSPVVDAIRQGAQTSGTSFDYLLATAQRESALNPTAKAPTSSASGLFQFIEQTWLGIVKSDGAKLGLGDYASAITARSDGSLTVGDADTRQAILKLREDPALSATMAGALAQKNRDQLGGEIGREPSAGDLYVAHVLGARGASELIKSASSNPSRAAALDFPDAAAANRGIFYEKAGRPRSSSEVYALLAGGQSGAPALPAGVTSGEDTAQSVITSRQNGPPMLGLFQTTARPGPVSDAVARIWRSNAANSGAKVTSFFPRETGTPEPVAVAEPASPGALNSVAAPLAGMPAAVPLPPPRPRTEAFAVLQLGSGHGRVGAALPLLSPTKLSP